MNGLNVVVFRLLRLKSVFLSNLSSTSFLSQLLRFYQNHLRILWLVKFCLPGLWWNLSRTLILLYSSWQKPIKRLQIWFSRRILITLRLDGIVKLLPVFVLMPHFASDLVHCWHEIRLVNHTWRIENIGVIQLSFDWVRLVDSILHLEVLSFWNGRLENFLYFLRVHLTLLNPSDSFSIQVLLEFSLQFKSLNVSLQTLSLEVWEFFKVLAFILFMFLDYDLNVWDVVLT